MTWASILSLLAIVTLVALHPELRALAGDTWREMISISPAYLALIVIFKVMQALFSALTWRNALLSAWPDANLSYRFVLGVDQGQDVLNTVLPARAGTWVMLGAFELSIRGAHAPTLLAVWAVQSLAFGLFSAINYALVAIWLPERTRESGGSIVRLARFASSQPLLAGGVAAVIAILLIVAAFVARRRVVQVREQLRDGFAILGTPSRYVRLIFLPSLASYLFRCASYAALLAAFDIPVTIWTLALALGSRSIAGAVRITPGGLGTTQAIDVIALREYAAPEVVTAYSLAEIAISAIVSFSISIAALLSVNGWRGIEAFFRRGAFSSGDGS